MTSDIVITTEGLTKKYGSVLALTDLNLQVHRGQIYGFLGPNGAGKTTTIRLLLDLIRPTAGMVRVLGRDPRRDGVEVKRQIGYLPGELPSLGRQTARELLTFFGRLGGDSAPARMEALADRLELDLSRPIRGLSKGNRQKIGLVMAFLRKPELLILDEPTSGLDPLVQQEFLTMVREVRNEGRTVFMSSHVLSEVEDVADQVGILRQGTLLMDQSIAELRHLAPRQVEIRFAQPVEASIFAGLPKVRDVEVLGSTIRCVIEGDMDPLVKAAARFTVETLRTEEPKLEDVFLSYYRREA